MLARELVVSKNKKKIFTSCRVEWWWGRRRRRRVSRDARNWLRNVAKCDIIRSPGR